MDKFHPDISGFDFSRWCRKMLAARRPRQIPNQNIMSDIKPVTWYEDPAHFRKTSRREFLFAGLVGGLGLTLGDYFKLRAEEAALTDALAPQAES